MPSQTTTILLKCSMVDVPALNHVKLKSLYGSPGTLHKDVGGAGTKVSGKTVGGVGTATLTTLSSINNTSNATRNKNNPVPHEGEKDDDNDDDDEEADDDDDNDDDDDDEEKEEEEEEEEEE
ncbi:hypothetical protein M0802_006380 [Mischocyttarus mexicanus]|nr:hypothetical protein M0802_006380 [Mischocyttarus mexicanus]